MAQFQHSFCGSPQRLHSQLQLCNCIYRSIKIGEGEAAMMLATNGRSQMKFSSRQQIILWKSFIRHGKGSPPPFSDSKGKGAQPLPEIRNYGGVVMFNIGLHFNARLAFPVYRRVLQEFLSTLVSVSKSNKLLIPIWKQSTATQRYVYTEKTCGSKLDWIVYHGAIRWLTNARTQAYNAFARTKMRQLNITIVDQFWQSTARPKGLPGDEKSTDAVHHSLATVRGYNPYVYRRVCEALRERFPGGSEQGQGDASEADIELDAASESESESELLIDSEKSLDDLTAEFESAEAKTGEIVS